jgi:hypothetical protein
LAITRGSGRRRLREEGIWHVSLAPTHDSFWSGYPLFAIDGANWLVVKDTAPKQPVYYLPPVEK